MAKVYFILLVCIAAFPCLIIGQERLPDLPDDNIGGVFMASPVTVQTESFISDTMPIRGYLLAWNSIQEKWLDTISILDHAITFVGTEIRFSEIFSTKSGTNFTKKYRIEVYNPLDWSGKPGTLPDSVIYSGWHTATQNWFRQKKVSYVTSLNDQVFERWIMLNGHLKADTIEKIFVDSFWGHRVRRRFEYIPLNDEYGAIDSTVYLFVDGLCRSYGIFDQRNGIDKPARRYRYQYFSDPETYTVESDFWSDSIGFWKAFNKLSQVNFPDEHRVFRQYDTLTAFSWQTYKRISRHFSAEELPDFFETELFPSFGTFPDTALRKEFQYDTGTGRLTGITTYIKVSGGAWQPFTQWRFIAFSSVGLKDTWDRTLEHIQIFTLGRGNFRLLLPPEAVPSTIRLVDASGRPLFTRQLLDTVLDVDLAGKPAGPYFLQVLSGAAFKSLPLVVP